MKDYLAHPHIGSSTLKNILLSPADFQAALDQESTSTAATIRGEAAHTVILEPTEFDKRYLLQTKDWGPKNKGEGKKKWDALKKQAAEEKKIPIDLADTRFLQALQRSATNHKPLQKILGNGKPEVTAYADIGEMGFKARCDWLTNDGYIWDVKTSSKPVDDESLSRTIFSMGYHFQAAHHTNVFKACGVDIKGWGWVFISTGTPYPHIVMRRASANLLKAGQDDWEYAAETLSDCLADDEWYGYVDEVTEIDLPVWAERIYD